MVLAPLTKKREHGMADRRAETARENSCQAVKMRPNPCHGVPSSLVLWIRHYSVLCFIDLSSKIAGKIATN